MLHFHFTLQVLKGLATGVSVCFATGVSTVLFGTPLSSQFSVGALLILVSVYFFSNPVKTKEKTLDPEPTSQDISRSPSSNEHGVLPK